MMAGETVLVLGGARSGKSRTGEGLVTALPGPWYYVATAQAFDDEMTRRIADHALRRTAGWITVEEPLALARVIAETEPDRPVLVDCLTLWLSNHVLRESDIEAEIEALIEVLRHRKAPICLVANEVGLGIVPDNALARRFRDHAGLLNQAVAEVADRVLFVAAGLSLTLKEPPRQ